MGSCIPDECVLRCTIPLCSSEAGGTVDVPDDDHDEEKRTCKDYAEQQITRGIVQTKETTEEAQATKGRQRRVCAEIIERGINLVR
jgi:hypothetical protein